MTDIPYLSELEIIGFRGFSDAQTLHFATPTGESGSGLTIIVGPNNSGKSSIIESLMAVTQHRTRPPTFSEGKRNVEADSRVKISIIDSQGLTRTVETVASGGSETSFSGENTSPSENDVFILPSRRQFEPFFGKSDTTRDKYIQNSQILPDTRSGQTAFSGRIFHINNDPAKRTAFEDILAKVVDPVPDWTVDQSEQGQYYLKYSKGSHSHSSDGLGEGLLSVFFIVDALYDSNPGSMIAIDEPELSLHPQLQAKVRDLLIEYSADRQIIVSTHAPKFIDWQAIAAGSQIVRVVSEDGATKIFELSVDASKRVSQFLADMNNPHVLGLDACEVFFLRDRVVLVEGQEDVMFFPKVLDDLGIQLAGDLYGWGVGGADKMGTVAKILEDLGFRKVVGLLDGNRSELITDLRKEFTNFMIVAHDADDIRHKRNSTDKTSLLNEDHVTVREEYRENTAALFEAINGYLSPADNTDIK